MEKVAIARLKNELSSYLDSARRGESILVLDREVPVAKIVSVLMPVFTSSEESDIRVKRLESKGIIRRGDTSKIGALLKLPAIRPRRAVNLTAAVLAEREEGR